METPGWPLDVDNDRMVDHSVDGGGGDDRVAEVIAELFKVDVCGNNCRTFTVPAINDLVEETGIGGIVLFQAVETDFIDEQDLRGEKALEFLVQTIVGEACEEFFEHGGSGDIAAAVILPATDKKQSLSDVAFAGTGVAGKDKPLLASYKFQSSQFHDLSFIDALLKLEIKIGEEFPVGQFGFSDPSFGPPLGTSIIFQSEQALKKIRNWNVFSGGPTKFVVEDGGDAVQPQFEKELLEPGGMFVLAHGCSPLGYLASRSTSYSSRDRWMTSGITAPSSRDASWLRIDSRVLGCALLWRIRSTALQL